MSSRVARSIASIVVCAGVALVLVMLVRAYGEPTSRPRALDSDEKVVARAMKSIERPRPDTAAAGPDRRSLSGSVSTAHGVPIAGAMVCELDGAGGRATESRCATTGRTGQFTLQGVEAPSVKLNASAAGYLSQTKWVSLPAAGHEAAPVTLVLERGGVALRGMVVDATGGPIPGALVTAGDQARRVIAASRSDASGRFRLDVAPGTFVVEAGAEAYSRTAVTVTAPTRALELVLVPASKIMGRVEAQGLGVAGVIVEASSEDAPVSSRSLATSAADGVFELNDLPAGRYQLLAKGSEWRSEPAWLQLGIGETSAPVLLQLSRAASLLASVRVAGEPCPEGLIELKGSAYSSELIRPDGTLQMNGVTPGSYELEVLCTTAVVHRERLELEWGVTTRTWNLEPGLVLTGRVEDARGEPVPGLAIQLEGERPPLTSCLTDQAGEFTCSGLAPGEYDCSAGRELGLSSEKLRIHLSRGVTPHVSLRLGASAKLRVTLAEHGNAHASRVFAQQRGGSVLAADAALGEVVFERLPLGHYEVFMGSGPNPDTPAATEAHLEHDGQVVSIVMSPPALQEIRGVVLDARGVPVVDTWVRASHSDALLGAYADQWGASLTDESGHFVLRELMPGRYDLHTSSDADEHWFTRIIAGDADVVLRLPSSGAMQGEVRDARGELVPAFTLTYSALGARHARELTGHGGRWALPRVAAGSYQLSVDSAQGTLLQQVELPPGEVVDLVLRLEAPNAAAPAATPTSKQGCCSEG